MSTPINPADIPAAASYYLIDVRTPAEYFSAHADGAINIPSDIIAAKIADVTTDRNAEIYLYCHSGQRAATAQALLQQQGYLQVFNLRTPAGAQAFVDEHKTPPASQTDDKS